MKFKIKVEAIHENEPATVDLEVEFEKGEYVEVIKEMPAILKQIKKTLKG